ncbi:MAG TPA: hypothetical protein VHC69_04425 [Polyangiaceae bacterium]|nr:hypothetical protein [Polyangiaceae bacterium]
MKPGLPIDPTDILALVLMGMFAMRRINIRGTDARAFPSVPSAAFELWQTRADRAKGIAIHACFAKFVLNSIWFFVFGRRVILPVLATGGWILFLGWVAAMMYAWWRASSAQSLAEALGIVPGTRFAGGGPEARDAVATELAAPEPEEASSR